MASHTFPPFHTAAPASTKQSRYYVTTAIPYVNAAPHLGFALELVQADVLARHRRLRGDQVRFLTGTDDNSLKNALAAQAAGVPTQEFVDANAKLFTELASPLGVSYDDFIRTSVDPRHRVGVERLWRACAANGDLYRRHYEGRYCVGCEQFYGESELTNGRCAEHGTEPQLISEENWFFRLSRYGDQLSELIESGALRIEPRSRRNEVLAFIRAGLMDFSVSRSRKRARGWGIEVPDDPGQVIYVWWDALGNYITALDYGTDAVALSQWWSGQSRRVHVIGKGILRFHAVYWPAMLLSAGLELPTEIFVHDYLTVDGRKLGKSLGNAIDPVHLATTYGTDALRWWLLREVPRVGDANFTVERLIACANDDLAHGVGNLVNRVLSMVHRYRGGHVPGFGELPAPGTSADSLIVSCARAPRAVDDALAIFDLRGAVASLWTVVSEANRLIENAQPWVLAKMERAGDHAAGTRLDATLATLVGAVRLLGSELTPFIPETAAKIGAQAGTGAQVGVPEPLFPRLELSAA